MLRHRLTKLLTLGLNSLCRPGSFEFKILLPPRVTGIMGLCHQAQFRMYFLLISRTSYSHQKYNKFTPLRWDNPLAPVLSVQPSTLIIIIPVVVIAEISLGIHCAWCFTGPFYSQVSWGSESSLHYCHPAFLDDLSSHSASSNSQEVSVHLVPRGICPSVECPFCKLAHRWTIILAFSQEIINWPLGGEITPEKNFYLQHKQLLASCGWKEKTDQRKARDWWEEC